MNRRELLRLLAIAVPAATGLPAERLAALEKDALAPRRRRGILDPHQFQTVDQLSEVIIPATDTPGAHAAGVAAFVEHMLADWYGEDDRAAFIAGLADVDARSVKASGKTFIEAPTAVQLAVVQDLEATLAGVDGFWARFRALTLYGFFNSEAGIRQVLRTPFMPGFYDGDVAVASVTGSRG